MAEGACLKVGEKEFCYTRKQPCSCGQAQRYADHNKKKVESWDKYLQMRRPTVKDASGKRVVARLESKPRSAEHHHIICVSSIEVFLAADPKAAEWATATNWCINDKENMIALPKWPMHLTHYGLFCSATPEVSATSTSYGDHKPFYSNAVGPPPFSSLPMHDQEHDIYLREINADLVELASEIAILEVCKEPDDTLKKELERIMEKYSLQLVENGNSKGGTHKSWEDGMNEPQSDWYKPFSMCRTPDPLIHPISGGGKLYGKMVDQLHGAIWLEGNPVIYI